MAELQNLAQRCHSEQRPPSELEAPLLEGPAVSAREASGACYKPRDTLGTGRLSSHRWCSPDRAGQTNRTCTRRARSSANSDRRKTVVVVMVVAALPVVVVVMVVAVGMPVAMAAVMMAAEDTVARAVPVAAVGRRAATAAASAATSGPEAWCKQE